MASCPKVSLSSTRRGRPGVSPGFRLSITRGAHTCIEVLVGATSPGPESNPCDHLNDDADSYLGPQLTDSR